MPFWQHVKIILLRNEHNGNSNHFKYVFLGCKHNNGQQCNNVLDVHNGVITYNVFGDDVKL